MAGFNNDVVFGENFNFSGGTDPSMTEDGQLLIGKTGDNPQVGVVFCPDGSLRIDPINGDISACINPPIEVETGGTGREEATAFEVVCGGTTSTDSHQSVAAGNSGQILTSSGTGDLPIFSDLDGSLVASEFVTDSGSAFPSSSILNILTVPGLNSIGSGNTVTISLETPITVTRGGTGRAANIPFSVLCGGTLLTGAQQNVLSVGTTGQRLTSNGDNQLPSFEDDKGGAWKFVSTANVINDATVEFNNLTESAYKVIILNLIPVVDNSDLDLRMSNNNGPPFAMTNYQYNFSRQVGNNFQGDFDNNATLIRMSRGIGTAFGEFGLDGEANFWSIRSNTPVLGPATCVWKLAYQDSTGGDIVNDVGVGISADDQNGGATTNIDAIQFFMSSGNILLATFHLYKLVSS